jgi:DNA polymerase III subunit gamma/tau
LEIYKKYRPTKFSEVVGQPEAIATLTKFLKTKSLPQTLLLSGGSGTGKTTICRILRDKLGCSVDDYDEKNCAIFDGAIETIRSIQTHMTAYPKKSPCKIYYLDEIQSLSRAGFAQQALLKMLEDTPPHVYFFLATTDKGKINKAIKTRATIIELKPVSKPDLISLMTDILAKEEKTVEKTILEQIADDADGSPRQALVELNKMLGLTAEEQKAALNTPMQKSAFEIVKALIYRWEGKIDWGKFVTGVLNGVDTSDVESLRHFILACARTELRKAGKFTRRAFHVLEVFREPWYEEKESGLERCCYEVLGSE